jgi:predicted MFS family arabinose efflux permease
MISPAALFADLRGPMGRATLGLGLTQVIGWGTTFLMPSVLGRHIQQDLAIPSEIVFGGITVMFGVGALISPQIGRAMDRLGARDIMMAGSVLYALALVGVALSQGMVSYLLCWAALGVASTLALNTPASIALAQVAGPRARQAISLVAIIGGLASTTFWPLSGTLETFMSWRGVLLAYAGVHFFVCLPIHFLVLPRRPPHHLAVASGDPVTNRIPREHMRRAYLLLSLTLSSGAFVFTGVIVHLIEILRGLGHAPATALLIGSLVGPAQVSVRFIELLFGHRYSIMHSATFGSAILPLGLGLALIAGGNFTIALFLIFCFGISNGLKAVQRATLPLALFGRAEFGAYLGRLALPQGIVSAAAPVVMAAILSRYGAPGALWTFFAFATVALVSMLMLARLSRNVR